MLWGETFATDSERGRTIIRPACIFLLSVNVPDSLCECVPPHFPCVTASFCYLFDLRLPDFHSNVFKFYNVLAKKCNIRELYLLGCFV